MWAMATPTGTSKHAAIRDRLREIVLQLAPGEPLPAERQLAEQWGVARMTVRQAIAALARDGLVRSIHGRGNLRSPATPRSRPRRHRPWRAGFVVFAVATATAATMVPVKADAPAVYDQQLTHTNGIFRVVAPLTAGAQEFTTDVAAVDHIAAYIVNEAAHGTIRATSTPTSPIPTR